MKSLQVKSEVFGLYYADIADRDNNNAVADGSQFLDDGMRSQLDALIAVMDDCSMNPVKAVHALYAFGINADYSHNERLKNLMNQSDAAHEAIPFLVDVGREWDIDGIRIALNFEEACASDDYRNSLRDVIEAIICYPPSSTRAYHAIIDSMLYD